MGLFPDWLEDFDPFLERAEKNDLYMLFRERRIEKSRKTWLGRVPSGKAYSIKLTLFSIACLTALIFTIFKIYFPLILIPFIFLYIYLWRVPRLPTTASFVKMIFNLIFLGTGAFGIVQGDPFLIGLPLFLLPVVRLFGQSTAIKGNELPLYAGDVLSDDGYSELALHDLWLIGFRGTEFIEAVYIEKQERFYGIYLVTYSLVALLLWWNQIWRSQPTHLMAIILTVLYVGFLYLLFFYIYLLVMRFRSMTYPRDLIRNWKHGMAPAYALPREFLRYLILWIIALPILCVLTAAATPVIDVLAAYWLVVILAILVFQMWSYLYILRDNICNKAEKLWKKSDQWLEVFIGERVFHDPLARSWAAWRYHPHFSHSRPFGVAAASGEWETPPEPEPEPLKPVMPLSVHDLPARSKQQGTDLDHKPDSEEAEKKDSEAPEP